MKPQQGSRTGLFVLSPHSPEGGDLHEKLPRV